jgi:hypothetical protein
MLIVLTIQDFNVGFNNLSNYSTSDINTGMRKMFYIHQGSNSCCSECESECCSTQNNVNDFKDDEPPCCRIEQENKSEEWNKNMGSRSEGTQNVLTNGLGSCDILPAVPEEPLLRVPSVDNKVRR